MKLNKKLMMAALLAASVLAGSSALQAQDATTNNSPTTPTTPPPGAPVRRGGFEMISKQLDLTDDQKPKVKPIWEDMQQQMREVRTDSTLANTEKRAKMKDIRDATTAKLKDILTADQLTKWEKMGPRRPPATPPATDGTTPPPAATTPPPAGN